MFYTFKHHTNSRLNSEAPLHPLSLNGNRLSARGVDLLDCGDIFTYSNLEFPTAQEANKAYSKLLKHKQTCTPYPYKINSLERLEWAVDSTKILDRATEYTGSDYIRGIVQPRTVAKQAEKIQTNQVATTEKVENSSFMLRLKNAWQVLKGN